MSPEWCVRGAPGDLPTQEGLLPHPGVFLPILPALCVGGEGKKGVKASIHMAPLFTMMEEGGHYLSFGSLGDTLWGHK